MRRRSKSVHTILAEVVPAYIRIRVLVACVLLALLTTACTAVEGAHRLTDEIDDAAAPRSTGVDDVTDVPSQTLDAPIAAGEGQPDEGGPDEGGIDTTNRDRDSSGDASEDDEAAAEPGSSEDGGSADDAGTSTTPTTTGWPDATNTGVPSEISLTRQRGDLTIDRDGTIVDGLEIVDGMINVRADNVTIRNSRLKCRRDAPFCLRVYGNSGTVIEDFELDGQGISADGIHSGVNATIRRANIHGVADGVKIGSGTTLVDSYVHDLGTDGDAHPDAVQATGPASDVTIRHNRLEGRWRRYTSAIILKADGGLIDGVTVENNLLSGGTFTFYAYDGSSYDLRNVAVHGNRFVPASAQFGACALRDPGPNFTWSSNVWHETGRALDQGVCSTTSP